MEPQAATIEPGQEFSPAGASVRCAPTGFLERLPKWLIVIPLTVQWLLLSMRYRAAVLPSVANPTITSGGLVGEGKTEYFDAMGPRARSASAIPGSFIVAPPRVLEAARECMQRAGLAFPIVAKPDIGWCGFGVRRLDSDADLQAYLAEFPPGERVLLQRFVPDEGEAGIFYMRRPGEARGCVPGLALRYFPQVTGDGRRTLAELIAAEPRLRRLLRDPLHRFERDSREVPAPGQTIRLSLIGSTRVGGLYRDGRALITPQLTAAIDAIARDMREFHFGRFDVRFRSEEALIRGSGFTVIEVNGAGSEAIEAWDPDMAPLAACLTVVRKQALLFQIAAANRRRGFKPIGPTRLARLHLRQQQLIRRYPRSN